ncbi:hypothetical protein CAPTEDRAFT_193688 [Capitella teleta]|uniref:Prenylcysteine lyase domain-containing protein n=1 Tax=Capitella teleta TaxID=283909 RepID=R7TF75_CAPTE|nr:hypothetical protein CAPTEDRAFT_193688 [Capitella teleta]|eukprot:ELT89696.1 hypothetical protein CAPTEDRAFT_193688 [Capitella teleta]
MVVSYNLLQSPAIVGAGIGGASSAFFLNALLENEGQIDVFERSDIGGRLATTVINGQEYETGGSIIHPRNRYLVNFTRDLGLRERERPDGRLGIFDGETMVFDGSSHTLMMVAQLVWHYGWDVFNIQNYVKDILKDFSKIYEHQENGYSFTTVEKLLSSMNPSFLDKMKHSTYEEFKEHGYSNSFIEQLVRGGLRSNYGQNDDIQAFVGAVSMAGVEPGLWSVHGGNKLIPQKLLHNTETVHIIKSDIKQITLQSDGIYSLTDSSDNSVNYDYVIIATPLNDDISKIEFQNFPSSMYSFKGNFHRTVATFVTGFPNASRFGYADVQEFPEEMFTSCKDLFFNSIGRQSPVDYVTVDHEKYMSSRPVYKVFSRGPLSPENINELFTQIDDITIVDWAGAYPSYSSNDGDLPPFQLHKGMFYVNAIESAASAMETLAIGGRNTALLLFNQFSGRSTHIDPDLTGTQTSSKTEL